MQEIWGKEKEVNASRKIANIQIFTLSLRFLGQHLGNRISLCLLFLFLFLSVRCVSLPLCIHICMHAHWA